MKHLLIALLVLTLLLTSCVSAGQFNALADEANDLATAVQNDPSALSTTKAKAALVQQDFGAAQSQVKAQAKAAQSGDWVTLAIAGIGAVGTAAAGMYATKRSAVNEVMTKRDATSASRTVQDLQAIAQVASFAANATDTLNAIKSGTSAPSTPQSATVAS